MTPLSVAALLDRAAAAVAVVKGLAAQGNPELRRREAVAEARGEVRGESRGKAEGRVEGIAESILKFLEVRGVAVSVEQRQEILHCRDLDRLDLWLRRAASAFSTAEVMLKP